MNPPGTTHQTITPALLETMLKQHEQSVCDRIGAELSKQNPGRDRGMCDAIFGVYSFECLQPYAKIGLASRAASVGRELINTVLDMEKVRSTEFHKGALFHDTGIAYFLAGDLDRYEYCIAMADEEDLRTSGGTHRRGSLNLGSNLLTRQPIKQRLQFASDVLNGKIAGHTANYAFLTGAAPIGASELDAWRQGLDPLHQFEFLRLIHELFVFIGAGTPDYPPARDNPFVLLRLTKALAHLAQWVESCLTDWQGRSIHGALSKKLLADSSFNGLHNGTQADKERFAGNCPKGADVDTELRHLLVDLAAASTLAAKHRYFLRILYIVRNSTAHTIEPTLAMYTDRAFLLNLMQVVFASVFVICHLKGKTMP